MTQQQINQLDKLFEAFKDTLNIYIGDNIEKVINTIEKHHKEEIEAIKESIETLLKEIEKGNELLMCSARKINKVLNISKAHNINDIVLVRQGLDLDSLVCGWGFRRIIKDLAPHIETDKEILYFYQHKDIFTLDRPLSNYLGSEEAFKGEDNKIYVFIDNSLSEEARDLLNIKYSVAFDNHTKKICAKTDIETLIINNDLGQRNYISASAEVFTYNQELGLTKEERALMLNADSVNHSFKNNPIKRQDKERQLFSLGVALEEEDRTFIINEKTFKGYYDIETETLKMKGYIEGIEEAETIGKILIDLLPQGTFKQAKRDKSIKPRTLKRPEPTTREKAIEIIKRVSEVEADNIVFYNDNLIMGQDHYINYFIVE